MDYLEVSEHTNLVYLMKTNDSGFLTHEVAIGSIDDGDVTEDALNAVAKTAGWRITPYAEWCEGDDYGFVAAEQITTPVSFVGSELPENHFELAKSAGVDAKVLVKYSAADGKVRAHYLTSEFDWGEQLPDSIAAGVSSEMTVAFSHEDTA